MKSPILPVSLPEELKSDIQRIAVELNVGVSEFIRQVLMREVSTRTGKTYSEIQHGGARQRPRKSCKKLPEIDPLPSPHRQDSNIKSGVRSRIA